MKYLAISILNWNSINDTNICINSLLKSTFQDFDIYLLDNDSKNNEYEKLKETYKSNENIILNYSKENLGFTGGNNFNIEKIGDKYKFILLLNNDTIIPNDFLEVFLINASKKSDGGIFGPEIKNINNTTQSIGNKINLYTGASKRYKSYSEENTIDYVSGSCFLIKYEVIKSIGNLDDNFFAYYEESDFCLRAKTKGYKSIIIPDTFIYHKEESANKKDKPYYCYLMFRNRILFLKKHSNIFQYIISYIFLFLYLIILFPKNFGIKNLKYGLIGILDGVKSIGGKSNIL